ESGPALHHDGCSGVVCQDECGCVIRRIVAPPTLPRLVLPFAADRAEHVAAEDKGAEAFCCGAGEAIVSPAFLPDHRPKRPGRKNPLFNLLAPFTQRMLQALPRPGPEPIHAPPKPRHTHLAHTTPHQSLSG